MKMSQRIKNKLKLIGEEIDDEMRIDANMEENSLFHLFFLKNDEDLSVEVEEVQEVDFIAVRNRLELGESVFISKKSQKHLHSKEIYSEDRNENCFFPLH